jgi:hypothetical protein
MAGKTGQTGQPKSGVWLAVACQPKSDEAERRLVDGARIELATSALRTQRSPS